MKLPAETPLHLVRAWVEEHARKGCICPACDQNARVYHRPLNNGHARCLVFLLRRHTLGHEWVHVGEIVRELGTTGGDFAQLLHWQFIEPHGKGWWRLTPLGDAFTRGHISAPRHADLYNGRLRRLDPTELVTIRQVGGTKFDLDAMLAGLAAIGPGLVKTEADE